MAKLEFSPIDEIISEIAKGKIVIIVDDPERENEADLVCAGELITPEIIAFMASHGRGLICVPITEKRAKQLHLELQPHIGNTHHRTQFTTSVDARENITTGISATDRTKTIEILSNETYGAETLSQPGHIFPIQGVSGGVLKRAGHTEAAIDLAKMAKLSPSGVICEIMEENGEMARAGNLGEYQKKHQLKACTIADLISYRLKREKLVERKESKKLKNKITCHIYQSLIDSSQHLAFIFGNPKMTEPTLVRVHPENTIQDILGNLEYGKNLLDKSEEKLKKEGGILIYLRQEKEKISFSQNSTIKNSQNFRSYGIGAQILVDLGIKKMRLLSNSNKKMIGLEGYGLEIIEQIHLN